MNVKFKLTQADKVNPLWLRLEKHLNDRLASLRAKNDSDLDERKTADLRGRITEVKAFLDLAKEDPAID